MLVREDTHQGIGPKITVRTNIRLARFYELNEKNFSFLKELFEII